MISTAAGQISTATIGFFGAAVLLLLICAVSLISLLGAHKREKKISSRITQAVEPAARKRNPVEETLSLTRTMSRADQIKEKAANFIGVDLQQTETYPIKWWLIPPIAFIIAGFLVTLATRPLGHTAILYSIGLPLLWWVLNKFIFNWCTTRRNSLLLEQFPDALSTVVRCVRVGIPIGEALRTVARDAQEPTKVEFAILADKVSIGIPLDVALRELALRIKLTEYQFFATALTLQARSGGGITQTLETLADVIRKRVGLKERGYALTAEARTSAMILAALPFVAGGAIFVTQRSYIVLLFDTTSGQACLGAAFLLMVTGMMIIRFMIANVLK